MEIIFKEDLSIKEDIVILSARAKTKEIDNIINEFNQVILPLYKNKEEYYVSIINTDKVFKINWLITSSRKVEFVGTHKHVFASRFYFKNLKERIKERVE